MRVDIVIYIYTYVYIYIYTYIYIHKYIHKERPGGAVHLIPVVYIAGDDRVQVSDHIPNCIHGLSTLSMCIYIVYIYVYIYI